MPKHIQVKIDDAETTSASRIELAHNGVMLSIRLTPEGLLVIAMSGDMKIGSSHKTGVIFPHILTLPV